jgi:chromate transporter
MMAGIAGSVVTTWVTYAPCFLWIFLGAPYIELLRGRARLNAALSAVTAAVVGVILNLSIWFATHTLFGTVSEKQAYVIRLLVPDWSTVDWMSVAIACGAMVAMLRLKIGMIPTLVAAAAIGATYFLIVGS